MASWFKMLKDGSVTKSKIAANTVVTGGTGSTSKWGYYDIINYTGAVGKATEQYADCPPAFTITAAIEATGANAYLLPWGPNKICWTKIQAAHDLFLTYAMNGCGVMISGPRTTPTIVHANSYDHPSIDNLEGMEKANKRCEIYGEVVAELERQNVIGTDNIATWYPGKDYIGAKSGVFGARVAGHWIFYGHSNRGSQADTKVIWPPDAVTAGDDEVVTNKNPCKCYLTTAACGAIGLADDCSELEVLRWFRDSVLLRDSAGRRDVAAYYETAPRIVSAIDRRPDANLIYRRIYAGTIQPAVTAIRAGDMRKAYGLYREMVQSLEQICQITTSSVSDVP